MDRSIDLAVQLMLCKFKISMYFVTFINESKEYNNYNYYGMNTWGYFVVLYLVLFLRLPETLVRR